jgi:tetratricopeptide (TPR) repeat protein
MQAKAVRYVVPLVPFVSLFAADLGAAAWMSRGPALRTWVARIAVAATVLYTVLYGLAFARIYRVEDSRVTAGRWIAERVAKGSRIGLEGGGFSLRRVVSSTAQKQARLDIPRLFYVGPYMTCQVQLDFLREQALGLDYLAVVDAGYYAQYTAVPELFPAVAGFYERLIAGELGFDRVQRFKVYPRIAGWEFVDDGAEPSFLGYDHPAVLVFARRNPQGVEDGFARWRTEMEADPHCADRLLGQVAELLRSGDAERAREAAHGVVAGYPMVMLAHILEAEAHRRLGDTAAELAARRRFQPENAQGLTAHVVNANMIHFIPGAAALSLAHLELPDLALEVLSGGVGKAAAYSPRAAEEMAQSYVRVAQYFEGTDRPELAEEVLVLSTRVYGLKEAYNSLAALAYRKGEALKAVQWWGKSLLADANQGNVFGFIGMVKADAGEYDQALQHLERAVQLAPSLASELEPWLAEARRNTAR